MRDELLFKSIRELAEMIQGGQVSPVEVAGELPVTA